MKRVGVVTWLALLPLLPSMLGLAPHPAAQSAAKPRFEVASVKPSAADPLKLPGGRPTPGRFTSLNTPVRFLILRAYGDRFNDFQIIGGSDWLNSRRFDIQAKAEDAAAGMDAMIPMLRTLLEERFKLKVHTETRELPVLALVVARSDHRLGPNITLSTTDCSNPEIVAKMQAQGATDRGMPCAIWPMPARMAGSSTLRGNGASMDALAQFLRSTTRQAVHDRTGLSNLYDWELTFARPTRGLAPASSASESPELTTAIQEQLGLRLESARGPVEVLVIDSASLPEPD